MIKNTTYIEEYYKWICYNPDKVCNKVKTMYKRLVEDLKTPKQVSFYNKLTNETETHTYIFPYANKIIIRRK